MDLDQSQNYIPKSVSTEEEKMMMFYSIKLSAELGEDKPVIQGVGLENIYFMSSSAVTGTDKLWDRSQQLQVTEREDTRYLKRRPSFHLLHFICLSPYTYLTQTLPLIVFLRKPRHQAYHDVCSLSEFMVMSVEGHRISVTHVLQVLTN